MTLCAFQLVFGRMYNQFSIKIVFLASLGIFEVGSLICAVSPSSAVFIVGRAIAGLGASGLQGGSLVLISAALPAKKLPLYLGAIGMVYGVAAVVGPVAGGLITNSYLTWRWSVRVFHPNSSTHLLNLCRCFYINLPIAAPPAVATLFLIKSPPPTQEQRRPWLQKIRGLDYLGMVLLLPGITSFLLALQFGGTLFSWSDTRTIACFVVAGALIIAFVAEQWWMSEQALVPPRLIKMRVVVFGAFFGFCIDSAFFTLVYYVSNLSSSSLGTIYGLTNLLGAVMVSGDSTCYSRAVGCTLLGSLPGFHLDHFPQRLGCHQNRILPAIHARWDSVNRGRRGSPLNSPNSIWCRPVDLISSYCWLGYWSFNSASRCCGPKHSG